jgi:hypothetical protein
MPWPAEEATPVQVVANPTVSPCKKCRLHQPASPCGTCGVVISPEQRAALFERNFLNDRCSCAKAVIRWTAFTNLQRRVKQRCQDKKAGVRASILGPATEKCHKTARAYHEEERSLIWTVQQVYAHDKWDQLTKLPSVVQDGLLYDPSHDLIMSRSRQYKETNEPLAPHQRDLVFIPTKSLNPGAKTVNRAVELLYQQAHDMMIHGSVQETFTAFRLKYWSSKARKIALSIRK